MVAYSFRPCFVEQIRSGQKRQTIRAERTNGHVKPGGRIQLYTGMRTRSCRKIGDARCVSVVPVRIDFNIPCVITGRARIDTIIDLVEFAQRDGFGGWSTLEEFWHREHPDIYTRGDGCFSGILIEWDSLELAG